MTILSPHQWLLLTCWVYNCTNNFSTMTIYGYLLACLTLTTTVDCYSYQNATKIHNALFGDHKYMKQFRPRDSMTVRLGLSLGHILELNEKEGYMTATFMTKMTWTDDRLNFSNVSSLEYIEIPSEMVWKPDLEVVNRYRDTVHETSLVPLLWLYRNGTVLYIPRRTYQTPCLMDMTKFPFDTQTCTIVMASWAYRAAAVNFVPDNYGGLDFYSSHIDWTLINFNITREVIISETSYVELRTSVTLVRRSSYFYYMYIVPVNVILFFLPFVHLFPPFKDCRVILLSSLLVCTTIMLGVLEDFMPGHASSTPNIVRLYFTAMMYVLISGVITIITMNLANPETKSKPVPNLLKKLLNCFGRLCLVSSDNENEYQLTCLNKHINNSATESDEMELIVQESDHQSSSTSTNSEESPASVVATLRLLVNELQIARHEMYMKKEWTRLAQVIDRLTGFFLMISTIVLVGVVHSSP